MQSPSFLVTILASATLSALTGYATSRLSQRSQRSVHRHTYRLALLAEVRNLHRRLMDYEAAFATRVITGQISAAQVLKVLLQSGDTVVFSNNAASIGLFDRRTALRVLRFYADVRTLQGRALVLSEFAGTMEEALFATERTRHLEYARQVRRRAHHLIRRLRRQRFVLERLWGRRRAAPRAPGVRRADHGSSAAVGGDLTTSNTEAHTARKT